MPPRRLEDSVVHVVGDHQVRVDFDTVAGGVLAHLFEQPLLSAGEAEPLVDR